MPLFIFYIITQLNAVFNCLRKNSAIIRPDKNKERYLVIENEITLFFGKIIIVLPKRIKRRGFPPNHSS